MRRGNVAELTERFAVSLSPGFLCAKNGDRRRVASAIGPRPGIPADYAVAGWRVSGEAGGPQWLVPKAVVERRKEAAQRAREEEQAGKRVPRDAWEAELLATWRAVAEEAARFEGRGRVPCAHAAWFSMLETKRAREHGRIASHLDVLWELT